MILRDIAIIDITENNLVPYIRIFGFSRFRDREKMAFYIYVGKPIALNDKHGRSIINITGQNLVHHIRILVFNLPVVLWCGVMDIPITNLLYDRFISHVSIKQLQRISLILKLMKDIK